VCVCNRDRNAQKLERLDERPNRLPRLPKRPAAEEDLAKRPKEMCAHRPLYNNLHESAHGEKICLAISPKALEPENPVENSRPDEHEHKMGRGEFDLTSPPD